MDTKRGIVGHSGTSTAPHQKHVATQTPHSCTSPKYTYHTCNHSHGKAQSADSTAGYSTIAAASDHTTRSTPDGSPKIIMGIYQQPRGGLGTCQLALCPRELVKRADKGTRSVGIGELISVYTHHPAVRRSQADTRSSVPSRTTCATTSTSRASHTVENPSSPFPSWESQQDTGIPPGWDVPSQHRGQGGPPHSSLPLGCLSEHHYSDSRSV